jgi:hypothetical protein
MRLFFLLGLNVAVAWAQLAIDGSSHSADTTSGTISWSHTVTSSNKNGLFVTVSSSNNNGGSGPARTVTGITWQGSTITPARTVAAHSGTREDAEIWCFANVATGTGNIVVTLSGTYDHATASAMSWTGVDQTNPCKTTNTGAKTSGTAGSPSTVTLPSATAGNVGLAVLTLGKGNGNTTTVTTVSPANQIYLLNVGTNSFAGSVHTSSYTTNLTAGSNTFTWTWNVSGTSTFWQAAAAEINQAAVCLFTSAAGLLNLGVQTQAYSYTPTYTGCVSPTFSITSGSLPSGLSLNASTGAITGSPSGATGTSSFTVHVTDTNSNSDNQSDSIKVVAQILSGASCAANSPSSILCSWSTSVAADSTVLCGTSAGDGVTPGGTTYSTPTVHPVKIGTSDYFGVTSHSIAITGLANNTSSTAYYCIAKSYDQADGGPFLSAEITSGTTAATSFTPFTVAETAPPVRVSDQVDGRNGMPNTGFWVDGDTNYCTALASGQTVCSCEDCGGVGSNAGGNTQFLLWNASHTSATNILSYTGTAVYPIGNAKTGMMGPFNLGGTLYADDGIFNANGFSFCCQQMWRSTDNFTTSIGLAHNTGPTATPVSGIDWNPVGVITGASVSGTTVTLNTTANIPVGMPISVVQVTCSPASPCVNTPGVASAFTTATVATSTATQLTYTLASAAGAVISSTGTTYSVSNATWSSTAGGTFVFTTASQSLTVNTPIAISGASVTGYNITCLVTAATSTTATCVKASTNPGTWSGTATLTVATSYVLSGNFQGYQFYHWLHCDGIAYVCTAYAGMDGWVYAYIDVSGISGGTYLGRIRIEDLILLDLNKWQVYKGTHAAVTDDGLYDSAWDSSTAKFTNGTLFSDDPWLFRKYGSKVSGIYLAQFNGWMVSIAPDTYGGYNSSGGALYYAPYPWNALTYAGKVERRVNLWQSYMPAFPHPLVGSFHTTNTNPLTVTGTVITAGVADMAGTNGTNDNYTTWLRYVTLMPVATTASKSELGRGQRKHNPTNLDLMYRFTDNLGSRTLVDYTGTYNVTGLPDNRVLNVDRYGLFNFGMPTTQNGSNVTWQSPLNYGIVTPYKPTLTAFTNITCFGQVPGAATQPSISGQIVLSKPGDFTIARNGTADTWNVIVKGTTIGAPAITDGTFGCLATTRDGSGNVAVYKSGDLAAAPFTPTATGTASGTFSGSALILGDGIVLKGGSCASNVATITVDNLGVGLTAGTPIYVTGATPSSYNVSGATVTSSTATTVTYTATCGSSAWSAGGQLGLASASLHGVMSFEAWWSRAFSVDELVTEMAAVRWHLGLRGITLP